MNVSKEVILLRGRIRATKSYVTKVDDKRDLCEWCDDNCRLNLEDCQMSPKSTRQIYAPLNH